MTAPWCFTLDPQVRFDLCDLQPCSEYLPPLAPPPFQRLAAVHLNTSLQMFGPLSELLSSIAGLHHLLQSGTGEPYWLPQWEYISVQKIWFNDHFH